ncbi:histidine phosphatase family protein [Alteromonas ponticola]|uniref:Histidine phosphatase family protein n=1 Tax=Alteromonas aquimaris TaxID=2998417 RepID=A0ABT3PAI7_9ALTE|nr:phosphoglycerate mutase family protein [Alteromonas aquimaris]MCW8109794.1 histidine phosphatase family protein [Alteromonas aquimaris]
MSHFLRSTLFLTLFMGVGVDAMAFDVYLTRHFEKQSHSQDPALAAKGLRRAKQLVNLLENADIKKIYSTQYRRTQQSVAPLSQQLKIEVEIYPANELDALAKRIKAEKVNVLVVGHSNTIPPLRALLGGKAKEMSEEEFGELFKLKIVDEQVTMSSQQVGVNE